MSLNSLTEKDRRNWVRSTTDSTAARPSVLESAGTKTVAAQVAPPENQITDALDLLAGYIPTEVIALYVAALSATQAMKTPPSPWLWWVIGVALTPVLYVVIMLSKRARDGQKLRPERWPWYRTVAATVAFAIWALAVPSPTQPMLPPDYLALIGLVALFVTIVLGLLDPILDKPAIA
jgi:hypothetical protein